MTEVCTINDCFFPDMKPEDLFARQTTQDSARGGEDMDDVVTWVQDRKTVYLTPIITPKGYAYKAALETGLIPNPPDVASEAKFNLFWCRFVGGLSEEQVKALRAND